MGSTVSCVTWEFRVIPEQSIRKYNVLMYPALADQEAIYPEGLSHPKFELDCDAVIVRTNFYHRRSSFYFTIKTAPPTDAFCLKIFEIFFVTWLFL